VDKSGNKVEVEGPMTPNTHSKRKISVTRTNTKNTNSINYIQG